MEVPAYNDELRIFFAEAKKFDGLRNELLENDKGSELLSLILGDKSLVHLQEPISGNLKTILAMPTLKTLFLKLGMIEISTKEARYFCNQKMIHQKLDEDFITKLGSDVKMISDEEWGKAYGFPDSAIQEYLNFISTSIAENKRFSSFLFNDPYWQEVIESNEEFKQAFDRIFISYSSAEELFRSRIELAPVLMRMIQACNRGELSVDFIDYVVETQFVILPGYSFRARYPFAPDVKALIRRSIGRYKQAREMLGAGPNSEYDYLLDFIE